MLFKRISLLGECVALGQHDLGLAELRDDLPGSVSSTLRHGATPLVKPSAIVASMPDSIKGGRSVHATAFKSVQP